MMPTYNGDLTDKHSDVDVEIPNLLSVFIKDTLPNPDACFVLCKSAKKHNYGYLKIHYTEIKMDNIFGIYPKTRTNNNVTLSTSIPVHSTIPDVSHAANEFTIKCTEGSGVGFIKEPFVTSEANIAELANNDVALVGEVGLEFVFDVGDGREVRWEATLMPEGRLLISIPSLALPDGSKESFVRLLEFAEDELGCAEVYVEFAKNRSDRAHLIRTFMYFGFAVMVPDGAPFSVDFSDIVMVYYIE